MKDLDDIKKKKKEHDKKILNKINDYIIKGENSKVIILFDYLFMNKSKSIAIKLCNEYKKNAILSYLQYKLNISEIVKEQIISEGGKIIQYISDNNNNNNKLNNKNTNFDKGNENGINELTSIAINLKDYQNMENTIKNELLSNKIIKEEKNNKDDNLDEINTDTKIKEENNIMHEIIQNKNFKIEKNNNKNIESGLDLFNELSKLQKSPTKEQLVKSAIKLNNNHSKRKNKDIHNTSLPFENKKIQITKKN